MKNSIIFFSLLILSNIIGYVFNIIISKFWDKRHKHHTSTSKKEVLYSLLILLINILIAIPGYILWQIDIITFSSDNFLISFIALFILMDFLMYVLHWCSHKNYYNYGFYTVFWDEVFKTAK
ncbi:hypothetical protein AUW17_06240 [Tenacibaculum dicentrarchi]|nr:hypothetical protein AUW17_06240 [Tenacibaculum dicentrarchi]